MRSVHQRSMRECVVSRTILKWGSSWPFGPPNRAKLGSGNPSKDQTTRPSAASFSSAPWPALDTHIDPHLQSCKLAWDSGALPEVKTHLGCTASLGRSQRSHPRHGKASFALVLHKNPLGPVLLQGLGARVLLPRLGCDTVGGTNLCKKNGHL